MYEVVAPKWADSILTPDVPYNKIYIFVFDGFHVEAYCRYGCDIFAELELVQNRGFASRIKTNHKYADISFGNQALEDAREDAHPLVVQQLLDKMMVTVTVTVVTAAASLGHERHPGPAATGPGPFKSELPVALPWRQPLPPPRVASLGLLRGELGKLEGRPGGPGARGT